jgi:AcrR family transcriptional regulator
MSGIPTSVQETVAPVPAGRRAANHAAARAEILDAARAAAAEHGLAGLRMRDLGARVGMRAQSIYTYFPSKGAILDALFRQGNEAFIEWMTDGDPGTTVDPSERARVGAHRYFAFCVADPVRHQLLFQRTVPDFTPSEESYAVAVRAYEVGFAPLVALGATGEDLDLASALVGGLVAQQLANDPGGDRWARLVDRAVDLIITTVTDRNGRTT